jgi:hypothetical protein
MHSQPIFGQASVQGSNVFSQKRDRQRILSGGPVDLAKVLGRRDYEWKVTHGFGETEGLSPDFDRLPIAPHQPKRVCLVCEHTGESVSISEDSSGAFGKVDALQSWTDLTVYEKVVSKFNPQIYGLCRPS